MYFPEAIKNRTDIIAFTQTEAAKPVLGKYYREPKESGPLPFHLIGDLIRSLKQDHYVSDTGEVVYYQTDLDLKGSTKTK